MNQVLATAPTLDDCRSAADRIKPYVVRTPLLEFPTFNDAVGGRVFFKLESLQRTGSFKFRGAFNAASQVPADKRAAGLVAASSGNHAQGVAEAARLLGCPATIIMPTDAPEVKRRRVLASGARIIDHDRATEDRNAIGEQLTAETGRVFIHPYNNRDVIAGQATAGLEIVEDLDRLGLRPDCYLCCCGGGGLLSGSSLPLRAAFPELEIVAVEPEGFDDWRRSLDAGHQIANAVNAGSVCDALLTPMPGDLPWSIAQDVGISAVTVSDDEALGAVGFLHEAFRLTIEPGGAVAFAAAVQDKEALADRITVVMLSGGNIDPHLLNDILTS